MGFSHSSQNWKGGNNEDSDVESDSIPVIPIEFVQDLKEQEIHAQCSSDAYEAINRLPSQDDFQKVKSKQNKKNEAKEKSIIDKRYEGGNVKADTVPENSRERVQTLKEVVNSSEQEIYAMLVECNMDPNEAVTRLLSQGDFQEVKSKRNKKNEAKQKLMMGRTHVGRNVIADNVISELGSETSNVQDLRNHLADSSTTSVNRDPSLNSDVSNVETKGVTISSGEAVPSLSVPAYRYQFVQDCGTSGNKTMADVVKMGLSSSLGSVTKAPVKDDSLLPEKPIVPNLLSNSFTESASLFNQNVHDGNYGSSRLLCNKYNIKNDVTNQVQRHSIEHNQTKDPLAPVHLDTTAIRELQQLRVDHLTGMNGSGEPKGLPSRFLDDNSKEKSDCAADLSLNKLNIRDGEQQLRRNVGNEQIAYPINSNVNPNCHSSSNYDQTEPTQESQYSCSSSAFSLFNSHLFLGHDFSTIPNAMHQQAYTRELDACYSASPLNQSVPTAISLGHRLSVSMTENNTYTPPSTYQQHGGSNNDGYNNRSIVAPVPQNINDDMRHAHNSAHRYSSAHGSGMSSYNAANPRLVDDDASVQHLNGNSSYVWTPLQEHNDSRRNYNSLLSGHQNQQSPSFRYRQQQEHPYRGTTGYVNERSSRYYSSLDQQNNRRRDPSNPTQQGPWPRNNY